MNHVSKPQRRILLYIIPVAIGLAGMLYSQTQQSLSIRVVLLCASLAVPLFAGGYLLARHQTGRMERLILLAAIFALVLGAAVNISNISDIRELDRALPEHVDTIIRLVGMLSLLLGLFVVLFTVIRTSQDIEEMGAYFSHLAEHMTEGLIFTRADGTILMVNDPLLEMFDLRKEDLVGQDAGRVVQRLNMPEVESQLVSRAKGLGSEYEMTYYVRGEKRRSG